MADKDDASPDDIVKEAKEEFQWVEECERFETRFDAEGLVAKAVDGAEVQRIEGE